jgi:electron transport complex protein RnfC
MSLLSLFNRKTFARGIHPASHKSTAGSPIRRLPFAPRMILPLAQHIGKPAVPLVRPGEEVVRGQPIARADGLMSLPLHAPADGVIEAIELKPSARGPWVESIVLRVYEASTQEVRWATERDIEASTPAELAQAIQAAGIAGMGGAAFPAHVKLVPPKDALIETLIINAAECEPFLTCDHRVMLEYPQDVMRGIDIALKTSGAARAVIGVEDNKPDAIEVLRAHLPAHGRITVEAVQTKYPQGAAETLIYALTGKEVPIGARSSAVGVLMNNVMTMAYIGRLVPAGEGVIERVVTVAGPAVERPGNYLVPIGTPMRYLMDYAGAKGSERQIILGGPMMGEAVASLDVPIVKGTSGVLVMPEQQLARNQKIYPCIKCGECVNVCPKGLNPSMLGMLSARREYDVMGSDYFLSECFECGCCAYVCPSHIPLVQQFRVAKGVLRERAAA